MACFVDIETRIQALAPANLLTGLNLDDYICMAKERTSLESFGSDNYDHAVALRALHIIQKKKDAENGIAGGFITSKKEKNLSVSFSNVTSNGNSGDLMTTTWGQQLQRLIEEVIVGARTCDV